MAKRFHFHFSLLNMQNKRESLNRIWTNIYIYIIDFRIIHLKMHQNVLYMKVQGTPIFQKSTLLLPSPFRIQLSLCWASFFLPWLKRVAFIPIQLMRMLSLIPGLAESSFPCLWFTPRLSDKIYAVSRLPSFYFK